MELFAILATAAVLFLSFWLVGLTFKLVWALLVGLAIGALARTLLPGRQNLGWFSTALAGVTGSFVGGLIGHRLLHLGGLMTFFVEVACAVGVVAVLAGQKRIGKE
jgi:uncharacterized membrane protein YeaQ/YmgE (transglycosylase-associated protein family)